MNANSLLPFFLLAQVTLSKSLSARNILFKTKRQSRTFYPDVRKQYQTQPFLRRNIRSPFFGYPDLFSHKSTFQSKCIAYESFGYKSKLDCLRNELYQLRNDEKYQGARKTKDCTGLGCVELGPKNPEAPKASSGLYRTLIKSVINKIDQNIGHDIEMKQAYPKVYSCSFYRSLGIKGETDCEKREKFGALNYDQEWPDEAKTTERPRETTEKCKKTGLCELEEMFGALNYDQDIPDKAKSEQERDGSVEDPQSWESEPKDGLGLGQGWGSESEEGSGDQKGAFRALTGDLALSEDTFGDEDTEGSSGQNGVQSGALRTLNGDSTLPDDTFVDEVTDETVDQNGDSNGDPNGAFRALIEELKQDDDFLHKSIQNDRIDEEEYNY